MKNSAKKIILASNSPRRKEILKLAGLEFEVLKSEFKEVKNEIFNEENIKKNSYGKALDVAQRIDFDAVVVGADTMVILDSVCLNKPLDISGAIFMLKNLSAKTHRVITAITLVDSLTYQVQTRLVTTCVTFRKLSDEEIISYVKTKKPLDKAGSYGIQDFITIEQAKNPPEQSFIQKIEGDYYNVMGISIDALLDMLKKY